MAAKARKLYFDYNFTLNAASQVIILTEESPATPGDRFGALLDQMPPLLGNSQPKALRQNEITAITVPSGNTDSEDGDTPLTITFLQGADDPTPGDPAPFYATSGTGTTLVSTKQGQSAVFVRNPRVLLTAMSTGGSGTYRGTLIVQRQHSIEI